MTTQVEAKVEKNRVEATAVRRMILLIALASVLGMQGCFGGQNDAPQPDQFDVLLGVSPQSMTINSGATSTATATIVPALDNNCGVILFSVVTATGAPLPNWLQISFSPSEVPLKDNAKATVPMSVSVGPSAIPGTSDISVVATCKDLTAPTLQVPVNVTVPAEGPSPTITSLSPSSVTAGGGGITLTVNGSDFVSGTSQINWNGSPLNTTFLSAAQLRTQLPDSDIFSPGKAVITVVGPGISNALPFTIYPPNSAPGVVGVISENSTGGPSTGGVNYDIALSATGRYAAFQNDSAFGSQLVSNPPLSASYDIFWHDSCLLSGGGCSVSTQLASINAANTGDSGSIGNGFYGGVSISDDGRYVVFLSLSGNLTSPEANTREDYIRDTCTGVTTGCEHSTRMISLTDQGTEPNNLADYAVITPDGGEVAFVSHGTNLVQSNKPIPEGQVYVRNTSRTCEPGLCTILVSLDNSGNPMANGVNNIATSYSGRYILFDSSSLNAEGPSQVYLRDMNQQSTTLVSVDSNGTAAPTGAFVASISEDGRVVAFTSTDQVAPNSLPAPNVNLYVRDTCQTESGPIANCSPQTITADATFDGKPANAGTFSSRDTNPHILSADGRFVVFASQATNLVPSTTPGVGAGIYVRDTCIGATGCTATTVLVSVDNGTFVPGLYPVISADGHYCAFLDGATEQAVLAATSF